MGCGTSRNAVQQPTAAELPPVGELPPVAALIEEPAPYEPTKKKPSASLMEYVKLGVPMLAKAVDAVAPMLPFPGGEAAALLSALLGMTERAIANHDNLKDLRQRAVAFLDILDSYHAVLLQIAKYHEVVGEYKEHLQGIVVYSKKYCSRNCVLKLLGGVNDEAHFQQLCEGLQDLTKRTMLLLQTDTLVRVQTVEVLVGEALGYLRSTAKYQDSSAEIEELVAEAGGSVRELVASPGLLHEALGRLDIKDRLSIQMVTSLLTAQTEDGPHRHIRQPDLQVLWRDKFAGEPEVPWYTFFEVFPSGLLEEARESEDDDLDGSTDEDEDDKSDGVGGGADKGRRGRRPGNGSGAGDLAPEDGDQRLKRTKSADSGGVGGKEQQLAELWRLLRSRAARSAFQHALDRDANDRVSVYELRLAFSGEQGLVEQVRRVLQQEEAATAAAGAGAAGNSGGAPRRRRRRRGRAGGGGRRRRRSSGGSERGGYADDDDSRSRHDGDGDDVSDGSDDDSVSADLRGRCMLPPPEPGHVGREEEAAEVAADLARHGGSLVLLAEGGMGKSSLAAAAGWNMYGSGALSGGALWVDLREAHRGAEVEARFCAALGIQREEDDNVRRIAAALRTALELGAGLKGRGGAGRCRVLVVVDNAEDAAGQEDAAEVLRALLKELVGRGRQGVRVLVTSRVPLGLDRRLPYRERRVGPVSSSAAVQIVRAAAKDLTEKEAERVAASCGGVPLYLRLVSEALVAGRLRVEDIASPERQPSAASSSSQGPSGGRPQSQTSRSSTQSGARDGASPRGSFSGTHTRGGGARGGGGGGGDSAAAVDPLRVVLRSLKPSHRAALQQLAVFPSAFDDEAAAAVLQTSSEQAHALLVVLYGNSLLLRGGNGGTDHIVHKAVRQALMAGGAGSEAAAQRADAEARYGLYVLRLLGQWAKMYSSNEYSLALAMARDRQPDIGRIAELLAAVPVGDGAATAVQAAVKTNMKSDPDLAAALSYRVCALLEALGALSSFEPAWRALQGAAERAGDEPQTAVMLALLARVSFQRGRYAEGAQSAQSAVDLLRANPRPSSVAADARAADGDDGGDGGEEEKDGEEQPAQADAAAAALNCLALCLKARGDAAAAEPLLRRALALRRRALGERHPDSVGVMLNLASCLKARGRLAEALPLYRKVLELRTDLLSDKHPDTGAAHNSLANTLEALGVDRDDAHMHYRTAVRILTDTLGEEHPHALAASANLARCLLGMGELYECAELARAAMEAQERLLGSEHPDTIATMATLAACLQEMKEYSESESLYRKVLAAWRDGDGDCGGGRGGGGDPGEPGGSVREEEALRCKLDLARCVGRDGRESEAESLLREVLKARLARLGPEHTDTLASQAALARCVLRQGRHAEAQALLSALLKVQRRVLGSAAPATLATEHWLADCILAQGDLAEAEAGLRRVLKARMRVLGTEHELTLDSMGLLAKCLMMQERFAEAQPIFELARGMGGGRRGGRRGGDGDDGHDDEDDGRGHGNGQRRFVSVQAN